MSLEVDSVRGVRSTVCQPAGGSKGGSAGGARCQSCLAHRHEEEQSTNDCLSICHQYDSTHVCVSGMRIIHLRDAELSRHMHIYQVYIWKVERAAFATCTRRTALPARETEVNGPASHRARLITGKRSLEICGQ